MVEYKMREVDEIIGRAVNLLCIYDRTSLEYKILQGQYHSWKDREKQRLFLYDWLLKNDFLKYITASEQALFQKKIGNPFLKNILREQEFQFEAIEPLLWPMGLVKRLSSYDEYVLKDYEFHEKLKMTVPDTRKKYWKKWL